MLDSFEKQTKTIRKWVNYGTVSVEGLTKELEYWASFHRDWLDQEQARAREREISADSVQEADESG